MKRWTPFALAATLALVSSLFYSLAASARSDSPVNSRGGKGSRSTATPTATAILRVLTPTGTAVQTATSVVTPNATSTVPPTVPATATDTATVTPTPTVSTGLLEQETVNLVNQRRVAMGLGEFRVDPALVAAARRHSNDIGPASVCSHTGTDGSSPWTRIADAGYTGNAMGEVVGCGFSTVQGVVDAWWNSPSHYAILTDPNANDIGCGWWVPPSGYGWQTCDTGYTAR